MASVTAGTDMNLGGVYNQTLRASLASGLIDRAAIDTAMRECSNALPEPSRHSRLTPTCCQQDESSSRGSEWANST